MHPSSSRFATLSAIFSMMLLLLGLAAAPLPATIFTVGSDGACTHASISAALFAALPAGADEVRIARNLTYTNQYLHLTDWSPATVGPLTLAGGYDTCSDVTPSGQTVLSGQAGNPVIEVDTSLQATSEVTIRGLELKDSGAEGLRVVGGGQVVAQSSRLNNNGGGGAAVVDGAELSLDVNSEVGFNLDSGISCLTGAQVFTAAHVHDNSAVAGGGVVAGSSCTMNILASSWIVGNAASFGGGIYASSSATVLVDGVQSGGFGTRVDSNDATDQGGGIYATGAATTVTVRNAHVNANVAGLEGGGLWASLGAKILLDRVSSTCFDQGRCSSLSGNQVTQNNLAVPGAAAWAESGADIEIYQTFIEENSVNAASNNGSVLYATGAGSTITVEGVQLWNNLEADALFEGASGAHLSIAFVTASHNVYDGEQETSPLALTGGSTATLNSSIFFPNLPVVVAGGSTITEADCLIVSNSTGLGSSFIDTSDPLFVQATTGNLRLQISSPAIDFCDTSLYSPLHEDRDHEARGFDLAANGNGSPGPVGGIFDLGMDEVRPLFADGFGTGNTSAWSATVP